MVSHPVVARSRSDLLQPTGNCHRVYSFIWWLLALEFFCLLGETASHAARRRPLTSPLTALMYVIAARPFVHHYCPRYFVLTVQQHYPCLTCGVCAAVTTFGMWAPHFRKHRPGVVSLLAVSTALAMIAANTFLALTHNVRTDSY